ncbi:alpha/beta hydrolase [Aporhodopirellula aestuarii]|uniref:Alpha/beta hydrolase n=1 Tax=Aporhodopirellula aestuarii TaxID=2950107 RepID=A0ABT0UAY9_9BACT|nr:alpha/beta hydrolase [Aporhodopirellula aestuarii]MCM2373553.1 alpha/beta hydrolase [Aporhodopirellula aestuarii]
MSQRRPLDCCRSRSSLGSGPYLGFRRVTAAVAIGLVAVFSVIALSSPIAAQTRGKSAAKEEEDPALKPRPEKLVTKDNVNLSTFYFPSKLGKEAPPVILVHEWKGQAAPYLKLCMALREAGFAVLVVEYRGHGNSKTFTDVSGNQENFNIATMGRRDVDAIVRFDIEEAKQFLKGENNAGRLNLNALCMIGIKEGSIIAGYWAARDWKIPSVGRMKQGQDVKALVYVSPEKNLNGLSMNMPVTDMALVRLPTLIIAGKDSSQGKDAERMGSRLETVKKKLHRGSAVGFEMVLPQTNLSGPALVNEESTVIPKIIEFLKANVRISKTENPWIERQ